MNLDHAVTPLVTPPPFCLLSYKTTLGSAHKLCTQPTGLSTGLNSDGERLATRERGWTVAYFSSPFVSFLESASSRLQMPWAVSPTFHAEQGFLFCS